MAKILITNQNRTAYLSGNLSEKRYYFTDNIQMAFCFNTSYEAIDFEESEPVQEFLEDRLTDLVDYDNPTKSIYSKES